MDIIQQFLLNFPKGFIAGLLLNGGVITLAYLLVWRLFGKRLQRWRIQFAQRADAKQIKSELKNGLLVLAVGAFFSCCVIYLSGHGYTKIYTDFSQHGPVVAIGGLFLIWAIDDTWFYWCHRLMHHPSVYRYVHAVHHESIDVTPFSSMSFHVAEAAMLSFWIFPVSFFMPVYAPVLGVMQLIGLFNNVKSHLGYEFYPANTNRSILRHLVPSTHHNMHHTGFNGNYGLHFRFWDKLCGTEFPDYEATFEAIQARKRAASQSDSESVTAVVSDQPKAVVATLTVHLAGEKQILVFEQETVLEAMLREQINAPYSCRAGKCGTCKAKLMDGKVQMAVSTALSAQELEEGYVLCCQSVPVTPQLEINLDR